jgi:hypothetical protein
MDATGAASIVFLDRACNQPVITKIVGSQTSLRFVLMMMMRYRKVINIYQRTLLRILEQDSMAYVTPLGGDSSLSVLDDDDDDATLKAVCFDATKSTMKGLKSGILPLPQPSGPLEVAIHTVNDVMKDGHERWDPIRANRRSTQSLRSARQLNVFTNQVNIPTAVLAV